MGNRSTLRIFRRDEPSGGPRSLLKQKLRIFEVERLFPGLRPDGQRTLRRGPCFERRLCSPFRWLGIDREPRAAGPLEQMELD